MERDAPANRLGALRSATSLFASAALRLRDFERTLQLGLSLRRQNRDNRTHFQ
jgi:hypothetical protein